MKKIIALILSCVALTGCNTITFEQTSSDGTKLSAKCYRMLWTSEKYTATLENGKATISAGKSSTDAVAMSAVTEAAVKAAINSAK